jgi:c-di-GMP-binding flagellar brake protein YcgR
VGQSGLSWAQSNIHSYYKIEKRTTISTGDFKEDTIEVDANTYANISATTTTVTVPNGKQVKIEVLKSVKTYYEYEIDYNERNRTINLLKPEFVNASTDELKRVLGFR